MIVKMEKIQGTIEAWESRRLVCEEQYAEVIEVEACAVMFCLTEDQENRVKEWMKDHRNECTLDDAGAIGGRYTYEFTPTGLGMCEVVKCVCGSELNVTDYDGW